MWLNSEKKANIAKQHPYRERLYKNYPPCSVRTGLEKNEQKLASRKQVFFFNGAFSISSKSWRMKKKIGNSRAKHGLKMKLKQKK